MDSRSHRALVLAIVVALHVLLLWWLQAALVAPPRPRESAPLVVEFLLRAQADVDAPSDPALLVKRRRSESAASTLPPTSRAMRVVELPPPVDAVVDERVAPAASLIGDDGQLRISKQLMDELDALEAERAAKAASEAQTYTIPLGDQSILAHRAPSIDVDETRFSTEWKPTDMNPLEEACWKNKGLAMMLSILGSMDCAYPGSKPKKLPEMIYYGRDDGDEILRKTKEWEDYERR